MSGKPGLSGGMMAGAAAATVAVAGTVGWLVWGGAPAPGGPPVAFTPLAATPTPATATPAAAPPAAPVAGDAFPSGTAQSAAPAATPPPADPPGEPAAAAAVRPGFDTFRHGRDGSAVVAGSAPGARDVAVLVEGAEVARATPDHMGRFAALFSLPPVPRARVMMLRADLPDGSSLWSAESLIIAPVLVGTTPAPEGMAQLAAAPATDPAPATFATPAAEPPTAPAADLVPAPTPATDPPSAVAAPALATPAAAPGQPPAVALAGAAPEPFASGAQPSASPPPVAPPEAAAVAAPPVPQPDPVPAPLQPANILLSERGVAVLRAGTGQDMVIDSISYSAAGAVQVAGKGGAGALVRLYLDNVAQFDTLADDHGAWAGTLPQVSPGLYTLRADQLDPAGSRVLARSETPFLREPPEALAAISTSNTAAAEVVTVQPGYTLWGIARQTYGEGLLYVKVFEANRDQIRNPDLIYPGQVFALPQPE